MVTKYCTTLHIYHQISPTYFGVCCTILRENITFLAQTNTLFTMMLCIFDVLVTVHLSIILVINQLSAQNLLL